MNALLIAFMLHLQPMHHCIKDDQLNRDVRIASEETGISQNLIKAIIQVESGGCVYKYGSHSEIGLMQLSPHLLQANQLDQSDAYDPATNILVGAKYLAKLRPIFKPRYGSAWFIAYNVGFQKISRPKKFPYYVKVMRVLNRGECTEHSCHVANANPSRKGLIGD